MAIRSEMPPDEHRTALTIPRGPEDVTPEWLREAMTRGGGRLPTYIADVRWTRVATGLLGNVVRLHLTYAGEAKGAPSTVIMKCGAPTPVARQLNRSQAYYKKEITFYERVATSGGVHVPSCYFTAYDAETGSGVLLLEDIVDGRSVHEVEGCVAAELIAAVGAIVSFHSKWWDSAVSEFGFPAWNDEPGYSALYAQVRKWFTEFYARYPENRTVAELGPKLVAFYPQVVAHVAKPPLSLCHSDYRLANVLFVGAGACLKAVVLDWQLIRPGRAMFDVGLFLITSCRPELRRELETNVLQEYVAQVGRVCARPYTMVDCQQDHQFSALMTLVRAINMFGLQHDPREIPRQGAMLERALLAVQDTGAAQLLG